MADSRQILNRIKECIHNNELELNEQVELFKYLANDILQIKDRTNLTKSQGKSYPAFQWHKGQKIKLNGVKSELFTDCE